MKTFETLGEIKAVESQEVTVQSLLNGRMCFKKQGWDDINLSPELREQICDEVVTILGGQEKTKERIYNLLMRSKPQHWGLERIQVVDYGNGAELEYCAGQDETYELNQIRRELKN
jgi:hypothetical protein